MVEVYTYRANGRAGAHSYEKTWAPQLVTTCVTVYVDRAVPHIHTSEWICIAAGAAAAGATLAATPAVSIGTGVAVATTCTLIHSIRY